MEYLRTLAQSSYFEPIRENPFLDKKMQKLIEAGKITKKDPGQIICEYGSKSNQLYFLLQGQLAVFIPKNESDINKQMTLQLALERSRRFATRETATQEDHERLRRLQQEWEKMQKYFDNELIDNLKQYQMNLKQALSAREDSKQDNNSKAYLYLEHSNNSNLRKEICSMKKVGQMEVGCCFGEIGAILDNPRTATIVSLQPSVLLVISLKKYQDVFSQEVLNLSSIFQEKAVGNEVVAHLATHFYHIPYSSILYKRRNVTFDYWLISRNERIFLFNQRNQVRGEEEGGEWDYHLKLKIICYFSWNAKNNNFITIQLIFFTALLREGDKIDGIYLIQCGYVEMFKCDKDYFNSSISIVTKGKGSLIGIEDYFDFDNEQMMNRDKKEHNNTKIKYRQNGRIYSACNKELNASIFKIDKKVLDHFIEGYTSFRRHLIGLARDKFMEYQEKFETNRDLKRNVAVNAQKEAKNNKTESDKSNQMNQSQQSPKNQQFQDEKEQLTKTNNNSNEKQNENNNNSNNLPIQQSTEVEQKSTQKDFPNLIKYEDGRVKDFEEIYEFNKKRMQRQNQTVDLTYTQKTSSNFKGLLCNKKSFFTAHLKKQLVRQGEEDFLAEEDLELLKNRSDLGFITAYNQNKSLQYICEFKKRGDISQSQELIQFTDSPMQISSTKRNSKCPIIEESQYGTNISSQLQNTKSPNSSRKLNNHNHAKSTVFASAGNIGLLMKNHPKSRQDSMMESFSRTQTTDNKGNVEQPNRSLSRAKIILNLEKKKRSSVVVSRNSEDTVDYNSNNVVDQQRPMRHTETSFYAGINAKTETELGNKMEHNKNQQIHRDSSLDDHLFNHFSDNAVEIDFQSSKQNNNLKLSPPLQPLIKNTNTTQSRKQYQNQQLQPQKFNLQPFSSAKQQNNIRMSLSQTRNPQSSYTFQAGSQNLEMSSSVIQKTEESASNSLTRRKSNIIATSTPQLLSMKTTKKKQSIEYPQTEKQKNKKQAEDIDPNIAKSFFPSIQKTNKDKNNSSINHGRKSQIVSQFQTTKQFDKPNQIFNLQLQENEEKLLLRVAETVQSKHLKKLLMQTMTENIRHNEKYPLDKQQSQEQSNSRSSFQLGHLPSTPAKPLNPMSQTIFSKLSKSPKSYMSDLIQHKFSLQASQQ